MLNSVEPQAQVSLTLDLAKRIALRTQLNDALIAFGTIWPAGCAAFGACMLQYSDKKRSVSEGHQFHRLFLCELQVRPENWKLLRHVQEKSPNRAVRKT